MVTVPRVVAGFYVTGAVLLGAFFSWQWAIVVALVGAVPAFLITRAAGSAEHLSEYYGRRDPNRRR
jgi:hypothetical protein